MLKKFQNSGTGTTLLRNERLVKYYYYWTCMHWSAIWWNKMEQEYQIDLHVARRRVRSQFQRCLLAHLARAPYFPFPFGSVHYHLQPRSSFTGVASEHLV